MLSTSISSFGSWSIDELAVLVGLPTRTIREYRTQGLISPPRMVGRVGRYHETHRSRLDLIGRLKARGYSLAAIADLCAASTSGRSLEEVLGGSPAAGIDEPAVEYTTGQLVVAVPAFDDVELREAATTVGLLHRRAATSAVPSITSRHVTATWTRRGGASRRAASLYSASRKPARPVTLISASWITPPTRRQPRG